MKLKSIADNIYWVKCDSQHILTSTFIRFQEHFESPEFRNKVFTLGQYREWYKKFNNSDSFTYYTDWSGFNVPSYVFKPFVDGLFDPLTNNEHLLMLLLSTSGIDLLSDFYIIGTYGSNTQTLDHEICHAMYHTNPKYRKAIDRELDKYDLSQIHSILKDMGYHSDVIQDETHAYICTGLADKMQCPAPLQKKLKDIMTKYFPKLD